MKDIISQDILHKTAESSLTGWFAEHTRYYSQFLFQSDILKTVRFKMDSSPSISENQLGAKSRITLLAQKILKETEKLEACRELHGIPGPTFEADASLDFYKDGNDIRTLRHEIASASNELLNLMRGPDETLRWTSVRFVDVLALRIIFKYRLAQLVPTNAPISLSELQTKTTLDPVNLARTLRHAMTNCLFREPSPGFIAHTPASLLLLDGQPDQDWVWFCVEQAWAASLHVCEALEKAPEATSLCHSGFTYAFGTAGKEPVYVTWGKDENKAKRFGGAMVAFASGEGYETSRLVNHWDLSEINERAGTIVDLGGSHGFIMVELAKKWKNIKFIIQDMQKTIDSRPNPVCEDETVSSRIEFQVHDFFTEQPAKNADVYFFRWIFHNYSAPYLISLLQNLIPALKPGARVVINEHCLSDSGKEAPWDERPIRDMDMLMLTMLNAQERDEATFRELFEAADSRFEFKGVKRFQNYRLAIVEAVWNPENKETA